MPKLILPKSNLQALIRERRANGADRLDEVWNGVYVISPGADNQHQKLAGRFFSTLEAALTDVEGADAYTSINVTDRSDDWTKNYRIPDASVFLPGNPAEDRESHWFGGPDFAVEVVSRGDHSRKKLEFYASVGVRELLIVDRYPWRIELHRLLAGRMNLLATSELPSSEPLISEVLPLSFRLIAGKPRPRVEIRRTDRPGTWII